MTNCFWFLFCSSAEILFTMMAFVLSVVLVTAKWSNNVENMHDFCVGFFFTSLVCLCTAWNFNKRIMVVWGVFFFVRLRVNFCPVMFLFRQNCLLFLDWRNDEAYSKEQHFSITYLPLFSCLGAGEGADTWELTFVCCGGNTTVPQTSKAPCS